MDITDSFNQKNFLIPKADFTLNSHKELISLIMKKHGEDEIFNVKMIDDNDEYDSFFVESRNGTFCLKLSFDSVAIFYEYMILKGVEHLNISGFAVTRNEIEYGQTIYYTIQFYEHSNNLNSIGVHSLLESPYNDFYKKIAKLHTYEIPQEIIEHLDNTKSFLEYQKQNFFSNVLKYVDESEKETFEYLEKLFNEIHKEMLDIYEQNKSKLNNDRLVHGNLDGSTIIENSFKFKFLNFEGAFVGSPFFDIINLVFELQMTGLKEFDFVSALIDELRVCDHRFMAGHLLEEYRICKKIWLRKKFLDLIKEYVKEVIVYNKMRSMKILRLGNEFSKHYYRFSDIDAFQKNKDTIIQQFNELILNTH